MVVFWLLGREKKCWEYCDGNFYDRIIYKSIFKWLELKECFLFNG